MASKIEILWMQALKTFSGRSNNAEFQLCKRNFEKLKGLMNEMTAEDVHVDKKILDYVKVQRAPMSVIDIFENQDITIAIFLLKAGASLPMHDHPEMYGLLKVICGVVKIDSFTIESNDSKVPDRIPAIKHPSIVVQSSDPACLVTPTMNNLHEITCLEGPCAFLDILSPPYETGEYGEEAKRPCTFYKIIEHNKESEEKVKLIVSEPLNGFYSQSLPYSGQPLYNNDI